MWRFLLFLPVTNCMFLAVASHSCNRAFRVRRVHYVETTFTKCEMKKFSHPVPAYFCVEYCESLPYCLGVTLEMGKVTSWCCAFNFATQNMSVCQGNHMLLHSKTIELSWQTDDSCTGCIAPYSKYGSSCFYSPPDKYSWENGQAECLKHDGDLAMIKTSQKQQEAKQYLNAIWKLEDCTEWDPIVWIGGYQMYYNNSHYWLDGDAVNVNGLQWYTWQYETDPDYYDDTHLFLLGCFYWVMADHHDPTYEFRFLCEKLLPEPV